MRMKPLATIACAALAVTAFAACGDDDDDDDAPSDTGTEETVPGVTEPMTETTTATT
jgi:hypothetical protein